ncbi:18573_t:CDS:2 [Acaulospora morrowiae]|uniref:18573_t:CDS:1 n=1 Tax=Acaulospora morrowiae TaxID=94023 RepID=A0A9N8Z207_9GLOM|nr:18573_t:CDS:2 [Acaulospora morrowiae]
MGSSKVLLQLKKTAFRNGIGILASNARRYSQAPRLPKPLEGIRVLELGQIKVEPPEVGDPIRVWRKIDVDGTSPWFRSIGRNKKSCEINLRTEEGRALARKLADKSDVLVENFRPGVMEKWGLGPEELYKTNPSLIYTRVSGFGQTGPYAKKPGFASVCEAMAGWRYINGFPDQPPVRQNISLGDSLAGLTAAFGTVLSLLARNKIAGSGQVVDVAIYESIFNMMEGVLPEYDRFGEIRQPSGTSVTGIVPTNAYPCSDSKYVIIGGNTDSLYKRLMKVAEREDLITEKYETNKERVQHKDLIDNAISDWTRKHTSEEVIEKLEKEGVPCGPIYNIKDIVEDKHVQSRNILETVRVGENRDDGGWDLKIPAITPILSETPGETTWAGPDVGQHNREILMGILEMSEGEIRELQESGIIATKESVKKSRSMAFFEAKNNIKTFYGKVAEKMRT